jgi:hypothetical protein
MELFILVPFFIDDCPRGRITFRNFSFISRNTAAQYRSQYTGFDIPECCTCSGVDVVLNNQKMNDQASIGSPLNLRGSLTDATLPGRRCMPSRIGR